MTTPVFQPNLRFNPEAKVELRRIGQEQQPVLVIDHALSAPDDVVEVARRVPFARPANSMYPGLNAPLPPIYFRDLLGALKPLFERVFGLPKGLDLRAHGFFALATIPFDDLHPMQKIPHQDAADPNRLGAVHFLCQGKQGGTGFFRHRATGFESIYAARREIFAPQAIAEIEAGGGTSNYDMTGSVEAQFNRLIVYRANVLHAGLLGDSTLSADPLTGRLTANSFIGAGPPE